MPALPSTLDQQRVRRFTFEIYRNDQMIREHTLILNPEEYNQREQPRGDVNKTLQGVYLEDWGRGLTEASIRGTTGYHARRTPQGRLTDGYESFMELRNLFRFFLEPENTPKRDVVGQYDLRFYNWEDNEFYFIYPRHFNLQRTSSRPLLYTYDFAFYCLRAIGENQTIAVPQDTPSNTQVATTISESRMTVNTLLSAF